MAKYVTRIEVTAAQWNGKNLSEMKDLLADVVGSNPWDGVEVYVDKVDSYFNRASYNVLKFYAWCNDQEVDPGQWVVVYSDGEGEIMEDEEFIKMGFMKK